MNVDMLGAEISAKPLADLQTFCYYLMEATATSFALFPKTICRRFEDREYLYRISNETLATF